MFAMSYLEFLIIFVATPTAVAGLYLWHFHRVGRRDLAGVAILVVVALVYTIPWDSWLIRSGFWDYPPDAVLATVLQIPIEEIGFMIIQTVLVSLISLRVFSDEYFGKLREMTTAVWAQRIVVYILVFSLATLIASATSPYMFAILAWASVPVTIQVLFGLRSLAASLGRLSLLVFCVGTYLSLADAFAIGAGIWTINPEKTLYRGLWGFPLEEAVFFYVTTLLVAQGIFLWRCLEYRAWREGTVLGVFARR